MGSLRQVLVESVTIVWFERNSFNFFRFISEMYQVFGKTLGIKAKSTRNNEAASAGNELFAQGKFIEANLAYTEALKTNGEFANLLVNRALCKLMLGEWNQVISDAKRALEIERNYLKAHFLLGLAYFEENEFDDAVHHLLEALHLCEKSAVLFVDDPIESALRRAYFSRWQAKSDFSGTGDNKHHDDSEIPEYFCCQICMDLLRDPVITPSGITYCKRCITDIIYKVGHSDPISANPVEEHDLVPNIALRQAIEHFAADHGWVFAAAWND